MTKSQLLAKTKAELLEMAQRLGLRGISTLKKEQLAERIEQAQTSRAAAGKTAGPVTNLVERAKQMVKRRAIRKPTAAPASASPREGSPGAGAPRHEPVEPEPAVHKFEVAPPSQPVAQKLTDDDGGELPESYGTQRLYLTARDPRWLYAYWDFSGQQMARYRQRAVDGRVVLRLFEKHVEQPVQEITLTPEARNWYIPVPKPSTTYHAELGYWQGRGRFRVITRSAEAATPSETVMAQAAARFVTIPLELNLADLYRSVREQIRHGENLDDALERLRRAGAKLGPIDADRLTEQQQAALAHLLYDDLLRRIQAGSFEISEWLRRRLLEELSSGVFSGAFSPAGASWGSGALGQPQKGFWFAVNVELIVYGATEPNATVTVDGKPIKLRPDGTFSFHYVFPDGHYRMPIVAVSADGDDRRAVELEFDRQTRDIGEVGRVKQPEHLPQPVTV
ncbi:MAG: DUF4912 domain-containing protein [Verrucomicrobiae bacterium]|nr:DUF4912 domain-containing protein [Verrucomicrobiae bacterium]